ncbi:hypothetical protein ACWIDS_16370 [Dietzia maris]
MSYPNRLSPPEPEFTDDEWDAAREQLVQERLELDWTREDAEAHIDDLMIAEKCEVMRDDRASVQADEERARRKENW